MKTFNTHLERLQQLLHSLNAIATADLGSDALLDRVVEETMTFTEANGAAVERLDGESMVYVKCAGQIAPFVGLTIPCEDSLSGFCVATGKIQRCDDVELDPRVNLQKCREIGIRSMLAVPLMYGTQAIGVIKASSDRVAAFNVEHVEALKLSAGLIAAVLGRQTQLEQARREGEMLSERLASRDAEHEQLREAAYVDSLTALANRRAFDHALEQALTPARTQLKLALLFIDINQFKSINDTRGHRMGDLALRRVADILRRRVMEPHFAARLSGDEFVVLAQGLGRPQIEQLCEQVLNEASVPILLADDAPLAVSLSIGAAIQGETRWGRLEWLRHADEAMYRAKRNGGGYWVHEEPMRTEPSGTSRAGVRR